VLVKKSHDRPGKILIAMLELSGGSSKPLKYEDIVVRAFKLFPQEFGLRGHPEFPDSSDIHKPLYGPLKRDGMVRSANKTFALTARGIETARRLVGGRSASVRPRTTDRLERDVKLELDRMTNSAAYALFVKGQSEKILDTDLYAFLGCTVRTPRNDFLGRVRASEAAVSEAVRLQQPDAQTASTISELWQFLGHTFRPLIDRRQGVVNGARKPNVTTGTPTE
jgi:hypothetical protein